MIIAPVISVYLYDEKATGYYNNICALVHIPLNLLPETKLCDKRMEEEEQTVFLFH